MQLGLRGRRRHLQDDERRRQLEEARRRLRRQRDLLVRHARPGRVPWTRDQRDRCRPDEPEPHLRRLGPGRSRPLARDRQRRHDAPRAGREPPGRLRVDRRRQDLHRGLERQRQRVVRRHRRRARPARPEHRLRGGVRRGLWRRSTALDGAASATDFQPGLRSRVLPGGGTDRTMVAPTVKNGKTRLFLTDGTATRRDPRADGRRVLADRQRQPAGRNPARLAGGGADGAGRQRQPVPGHLQRLAAADLADDGQPVLRDGRLLHRSVLVRQRRLHAGGHARHGVRDRLVHLRRAALQHEGRRLRERSLERPRASSTRTPPATPTPANNNRTFTDLTYDNQDNPANWCALAGISPCLRAPNSIHPDQHEIVINPSNPTQIFEASDGGVIRTDGRSPTHRASARPSGPAHRPAARSRASGSSRGSRTGSRTSARGSAGRCSSSTSRSTRGSPCDVMGGTQDNGTWSAQGCDTDHVPQIIYGDGGNAGFDSTNPTWRFNEFTPGSATRTSGTATRRSG